MQKTSFILVFVFILFLGKFLNAQKISYGGQVGIDMVSVQVLSKYDYLLNQDLIHPMLSFNANAYLAYRSKGVFGISIEPGFIKKGSFKDADKQNDYSSEAKKIIFNYLQIPVFADFYVNRWVFSIGPELAYLLSIKNIATDEVTINNDIDKPFQLSMMAGITYHINDKIDLSIRYNHELPYYKDPILIYHHYLQFLIRFKIDRDLSQE